MPGLPIQKIITIILCVLVIVFIAFFATSMLPRNSALAQTLSLWGESMGLPATFSRVTTIGATAQQDTAYTGDPKPYMVILSWKANSKGACDDKTDESIYGFTVTDEYSPNIDGSNPVTLKSGTMTGPTCDSSPTGPNAGMPDCRCTMDGCVTTCFLPSLLPTISVAIGPPVLALSYGGQHKFTLKMLDKDGKEMPQTYTTTLKFYTAPFVENYNKDISGTYLAPFTSNKNLYILTDGIKYDTKLNTYKCKSRVVWEMAYETYVKNKGGGIEGGYCPTFTGVNDPARIPLSNYGNSLMGTAFSAAGIMPIDFRYFKIGTGCNIDLANWGSMTDAQMLAACPLSAGAAAIDKAFGSAPPAMILKAYCGSPSINADDPANYRTKSIESYSACTGLLIDYLNNDDWTSAGSMPDKKAEASAVIDAAKLTLAPEYQKYLG
jgi:hypothetical protein